MSLEKINEKNQASNPCSGDNNQGCVDYMNACAENPQSTFEFNGQPIPSEKVSEILQNFSWIVTFTETSALNTI
jgi:hypothetical protein